MKESKDRNNFDALRLLGALLVLFSHQFALSGRWEPRAVGGHSFGNIGVLIFFSISGYLVTSSWLNDPNLWRFSVRRTLRMAPALVVSMTITLIVVDLLGLAGFPGNPYHLLNGSLWTIPFEVICYLMLAGVGLLTRRPAQWLAALIVTLFVLAGGQHGKSFVAYFGLYFAMGGLLRVYPYLRTPLVTALFFVIGYALVPIVQTRLGLTFIVAPLAIAVGTRSWPILRSAGRFGDLSYGIYIYAWPVQQVLVAELGASTPYAVLLACSLSITLALAAASWHLVEKTALHLKPHRQPSGNAAVGTANVVPPG